MSIFLSRGLGWHRDMPTPHDYTPRHPVVAKLLKKLKRGGARPDAVDWRQYCNGVDDQHNLGSSPAHACVALLGYFQRRSSGKVAELSTLFVYQTARRLLHWKGDSGAELRSTWKAISRFGAPPEQYWPFDPARLEEEPDAFVCAAAVRYPAVCYVRLDGRGKRGMAALETVKSFLHAGFPSVFGFPACTSLSEEPEIPFPTVFDSVRGGQAVVALGYDDNRRIRSDKGALLIRNSWGSHWGDQGYGWLPYSYVRRQLAVDFWTLLKPDWLESGEFEQPE